MNRIIVYSLLAILPLLFVVGIAIVGFGSFQGQEFSPDLVSRRTFSYSEIPLLQLQVTQINHSDISNDLEKYLAGQGFASEKGDSEYGWHLIADNWTHKDSPELDARYLCRYLDEVNEAGDLYWLKWSKDHTDFAKVLWPMVFRLAKEHHYLPIPSMMETARNSSDKSELQDKLKDICREHLADVAREKSELGDLDGALAQIELAFDMKLSQKKLLQVKVEILRAHDQTAQAKDIERELSKVE